MAHTAKKPIREKGILSTLNPKPSHSITDLVVSFYESDDSNQLILWMKDCEISQMEEGCMFKKRLVLSNLQELYQNFKQKHPTASIGFSKFAEL